MVLSHGLSRGFSFVVLSGGFVSWLYLMVYLMVLFQVWVSRLDGSFQKILIETVSTPLAMVIDPIRRYETPGGFIWWFYLVVLPGGFVCCFHKMVVSCGKGSLFHLVVLLVVLSAGFTSWFYLVGSCIGLSMRSLVMRTLPRPVPPSGGGFICWFYLVVLSRGFIL